MKYVTWTRLLLLGGADEGRLSRWSREMSDTRYDHLMGPFRGSHKESWLVLIRQTSFLLLQNASRDPWYVLPLGHASSSIMIIFIFGDTITSALNPRKCISNLLKL